MRDIALRAYAEADFDDVTSLWLASWQSTGVPSQVTLAEVRERWPAELAAGWIVHVAVTADRILGFIAWRDDVLEQLFIAPDCQGRGVGKQLLDYAKAAMPRGFRLHTALASRAGKFYEREGLRRGESSIHPRLGHPIVDYHWTPLGA